MNKFIIVKAPDLEELEEKINELIKQGYVPNGRMMDTYHLKNRERGWIMAMFLTKKS